MKHIFTKYLLIATVALISLTQLALAQTDKAVAGKSRLDIGKKATAKVQLPSKSTPKLTYFPFDITKKEIRFQQPAFINQYFKSVLLTAKPASKTVKKSTPVPLTEETVNNFPIGDKLYVAEGVSVSSIYPNPASDVAYIDYTLSSNSGDANILIYNILGDEIANFELNKDDRRLRVQTSSLPAGVYFYQLSLGGRKLTTKKLLVRHQ